MKASAIKRERPPADPLRVQLQEAIKNATEAREAFDRHRNAITKTRTAKWSAEKVHEVAVAGVDKAIAEHAENLAADAGGADADDVAPTSSLIRMARLAVVDAADEVESFRGAYDRLRQDLPLRQADADRTAAEVENAISAVLAPIAEQLLARLRELIAEAAPYRSLLVGLLDAHRLNVIGSSEGRRSLEPALDAAGKLTWAFALED